MTRRELAVAATCAAGLGLVMMDNTAVTIALPRLGEGLGSNLAGLQWVVAVMVLATAATLPVSGALGDRVGPRTVYRTGLLTFLAGAGVAAGTSVVAGLPGLLLGRAVQGIGAALMLPNGVALLGTNVPASRRSRMVATWITLSALGLIVGPVAGGWLVEHVDWRAVFVLEAAPALLGHQGARRLADGPRTREASFDLAGALIGSLAVGGLCLAAVELGRDGGRPGVALGALGVSVLAAAAFWPLQRRAARPAVDMGLFRDRRYAALMAACAGYNAVIAGEAFLLSLLLQDGRGASASRAGLVLLAATILMPIGSQVTGRLVARSGLRRLMAGAAVMVAVTLIVAGNVANGPLGPLATVLSLTGLASGMLFAGDTLAVLHLVAVDRVSSGLATLSMVRQCGSALGVAALGATANVAGRLLDNRFDGLRVGIIVAGVSAVPAAALLGRYLQGAPRSAP